jgi:hypothetical protein
MAATPCKANAHFLFVQLTVQQLKLCSLIVAVVAAAAAAAATHLLLLQHSQLLHRHVHNGTIVWYYINCLMAIFGN